MEKEFTIVVADDDLDDQDLMNRAFKESKVKIKIVKVFNGLELLDYLQKKEKFKRDTSSIPNLILLDLNMPLMDGFEALAAIKKIDPLKDIPIYIITTSKSEKEKLKALSLGATGFYHKGASSKEIHRIVKEVCFECFA